MPDILDQLKRPDLEQFRKDFRALMRVAIGMDKDYGKLSKDFDFYLSRYKKLVRAFNRKYKKLFLKTRATETEFRLLIYIREKDVKKIFSEVASKFSGLRSIGSDGFGVAEVSDARAFQNELDNIKDKIYISYYEAESGSNTIYLEHHKRQKKAELHYNRDTIAEGKSPEFKLIAYYAVKDGLNDSINIMQLASEFGFTSYMTYTERDEWKEDFNPEFRE